MKQSQDDLLRGIAAAPPPFEPESWLSLFGPDLSPERAAELKRRLAAIRAERHPDLPLPERLALLRRELAARGVDGFVLQRTDSFNSEYLPASAERMAWLTGFTGSAGECAVLRERAAVFVDGRYTVQVAEQVDPKHFDICHITDRPPARWIEEVLPEGGVLGYDPMLTKAAERTRLEKAVAKRGGRLVALDGNPVDAVWHDRPPSPVAAVAVLDEAYAGQSSAAKRERLASAIAEKGARYVALTASDSVAWLLNVRGGDIPFNPLCLSYALLAEDATCRWFVDPRKIPPGLRLDNAIQVEPEDAFLPALDALGAAGAAVLVDPATTHVGFVDRLRGAGAAVIEGDDPCVLPKACKNAVETAGAFSAQRRDGAALVRFLAWLDGQPHDGTVSEMSAAARLEAERARDPLFRGPSFFTISAHGPHSAIPHYRPLPESDRPLTAGTLYLVDSGGQYLDATTDVTRTVPLGEPTATMRRDFTLVLKGHIAMSRVVFPVGTSGSQLDSLARVALWQAGMDYDHGTGHGVGAYLCVHEGPARLSKVSTVPLKPGMILSNEPGCYRPDEYGIRTENLLTVATRPKVEGGNRELLGFDTFTLCPIDRRLIDTALLDAGELAWVDAYHARVEEELAPLVGEARAWLAKMCGPL